MPQAQSLNSSSKLTHSDTSENISAIESAKEVAKNVSEKMNNQYKQAESYFKDLNLSNITQDVKTLAQKHPFVAVGICVGLGAVVGRLLTRK